MCNFFAENTYQKFKLFYWCEFQMSLNIRSKFENIHFVILQIKYLIFIIKKNSFNEGKINFTKQVIIIQIKKNINKHQFFNWFFFA